MSGLMLIRADAGASVGAGHVMRCLALAQAWQRAGGEVVLAAIALPEMLRGQWVTNGFRVVESCGPRFSDADAAHTTSLAAALSARVLVLDGYGFDGDFQRRCRNNNQVVVVLDDNAENGPFTADVVLNQNLHAEQVNYSQRARETTLLLGSEYALLRSEFLVPAEQRVAELPRRILVTLGGADVGGATPTILDALRRLPWPGTVDVVVGPVAKLDQSVEHQVTFHRNVLNMAPLMLTADLAIVAAGSTCWELAHFGVPLLMVVAADNQRALAQSLENAGLGFCLGSVHGLEADSIMTGLRRITTSLSELARMSARGMALIDGRGADRAVARIAAVSMS